MDDPHFVVVVGPIASGKSTVAAELGARLRGRGRAVAVLDLDDVVETIGGFGDLTAGHFAQAMTVHGELVGAWLRQGFDVVTHGPFLDRDEDDALVHAVPAGIEPRRVRLLATFAVALERVAADPGRSLSKQPEILRRAYARAARLLAALPPSEWTFDTTTSSSHEVVDELVAALVG